MSEFFPHRRGLALFLNAGDPPLDVLRDVVLMLDEQGVDCLELAVPFPNSVTDGPVIRQSALRALAGGDVELHHVLGFVNSVRAELRHLRIVLFADWGYTVRARGLRRFVGDVAAAGAHGALIHGLPPRLRPDYYGYASAARLPLVTTCYAGSSREVLSEAARHVSAYVYLVAHYGRSGTGPAPAEAMLAAPIGALRAETTAPVAVGFGVKTGADVARVHALGADAAIVGSAVVARVESSLTGNPTRGHDVVDELADLVADLQPSPEHLTPLTGAKP